MFQPTNLADFDNYMKLLATGPDCADEGGDPGSQAGR